MFPCPATTVAMHLFTSPMHTEMSVTQQLWRAREEGRRRVKLLEAFKNGHSSVFLMRLIM